MKHFLVDVARISSEEPRSTFDSQMVERLADSILESGGLLEPLVLVASGPEDFKVVDRHLEYWAAVRAREKNPQKGEMVNAYVIVPEKAIPVGRQLGVIKLTQALPVVVCPPGEQPRVKEPPRLVEDAIENLRQSFREELQALAARADAIEGAVKKIGDTQPVITAQQIAVEMQLFLQEEFKGIDKRLEALEGLSKQPVDLPAIPSAEEIAQRVGQPLSEQLGLFTQRLEEKVLEVLSAPPRFDGIEEVLNKKLAAIEEILSKSAAPQRTAPALSLPEAPYTKKGLEKLTVAVLKEFVKTKGIPTWGARRKQEFINAILKWSKGEG